MVTALIVNRLTRAFLKTKIRAVSKNGLLSGATQIRQSNPAHQDSFSDVLHIVDFAHG